MFYPFYLQLINQLKLKHIFYTSTLFSQNALS